MSPILLATRSPHKLREIHAILAPVFHGEIITLDDIGIPTSPAEDAIEAFETFHQNARAKARYFFERTGLPALADDSGIEVDALRGAPGVRSRRFCGRTDLEGVDLDRANNALLLERLAGARPERRGARYVCAATLFTPEAGERTALGIVTGRILEQPAGSDGFGYDPLFFLPELACTFGQVPPPKKHRWSHRGRAFRALAALGIPGSHSKR